MSNLPRTLGHRIFFELCIAVPIIGLIIAIVAFKFATISHGASPTSPTSVRAWVYIATIALLVSFLALWPLIIRATWFRQPALAMKIRVVSWIFILAATALLWPLRHIAKQELTSQFPQTFSSAPTP